MDTPATHPPSPVRRALVFFLKDSERERFDLVMNGAPQRIAELQNGALNVVRSLRDAQLMKPTEEEGVYVIDPFVGHKIVRIDERHNYRLPKAKYAAIRHVQKNFVPDAATKYQRESKAALQTLLDDWATEQGHEATDFQVGPWLMCGKLNTNPSSGSGIVYFYVGDPIYYVTIPGLEAFKLEESDKERTRSTTGRKNSKKSTAADPLAALTAPIEERLQTLRDEEQRLQALRATLQEKMDLNKAQLESIEAEELRLESSLNVLRGK